MYIPRLYVYKIIPIRVCIMYCIDAIIEIYTWIILDLLFPQPYYPIPATLTSASSPVPTLLRHFGRRHKKERQQPTRITSATSAALVERAPFGALDPKMSSEGLGVSDEWDWSITELAMSMYQKRNSKIQDVSLIS